MSRSPEEENKVPDPRIDTEMAGPDGFLIETGPFPLEVLSALSGSETARGKTAPDASAMWPTSKWGDRKTSASRENRSTAKNFSALHCRVQLYR